MRRSTRLLVLPALVGLAAVACSAGEEPSEPLAIHFKAQVGERPFACGTTYEGLGTTAATFQATDFRLYVHDVAVIHGDGSREALTLEASAWQNEGVVLLDFEDQSGECMGSPETNAQIVGGVSDASDVAAIELTLGVPEAQNHLDSASAPSPLNIPGMYWSWMGGYKYLRVDLLGAGGEPFVFHLGATGCTGSTAEGFACANQNRITLRFEGFDPTSDALAVDLAALVAGADLTTPNDKDVDPVDGCMSAPTDPECPPLFTALGLSHGGDAVDPAAQTVFQVVER